MTTSFRFRLVTILLGILTFLALRGLCENRNHPHAVTARQISLNSAATVLAP